MTELINEQVGMFAVSFVMGAVMGITYDLLRVIRRIVIHNLFFVSVEDFFYWFVWTIALLRSINTYNYGQLSLYIFVALLLGYVIYHYTIGWVFMKLFNYIWCSMKKCVKRGKNSLKK